MKRTLWIAFLIAGAMSVAVGRSVMACCGSCGGGNHQHEQGAQGTHDHQADPASDSPEKSHPLHGGYLRETKHQNFETVIAPDGVRVYRYSKAGSPRMIDGATGNVTMKLADGTEREIPLVSEPPQRGEPTVYFCPMHASIVQMEPGTCKLCGGMQLVEQDRLYAALDLSKVEPGGMKGKVRLKGLGDPEPKVDFKVDDPEDVHQRPVD